MYPVNLEGERLRLREFMDGDADGIFRIYGSEKATRTLSFEPRTHDHVMKFVKTSMERAEENPRVEYALAAALKSSDEAIGSARLAIGDHKSGQIGFALNPDHWGHGLGRELASLLLTLGFEHVHLHRMWGARAPYNVASARLMSSLGMVEEGRIRDHVYVRRAWRDSIVHSILEDEWAAASQPRRQSSVHESSHDKSSS